MRLDLDFANRSERVPTAKGSNLPVADHAGDPGDVTTVEGLDRVIRRAATGCCTSTRSAGRASSSTSPFPAQNAGGVTGGVSDDVSRGYATNRRCSWAARAGLGDRLDDPHRHHAGAGRGVGAEDDSVQRAMLSRHTLHVEACGDESLDVGLREAGRSPLM